MAAAGMDLAVYGLSANFLYLTGLSIDWRSSIEDADNANHVFVPRNGDPVLVLHEMHSPHASQTPIADVRICEQGSPYTTLLGKIVCDLGVRMCDILPVLENTMDRLGFGDYLRARLTTGVLGHSIGIELHEDPWIRPDCEKRLQPNMVLALEPKIWHVGAY